MLPPMNTKQPTAPLAFFFVNKFVFRAIMKYYLSISSMRRLVSKRTEMKIPGNYLSREKIPYRDRNDTQTEVWYHGVFRRRRRLVRGGCKKSFS